METILDLETKYCSKTQDYCVETISKCLPTRGNLAYRNTETRNMFSLCFTQIESQDHLFLQCPITRKYWDADVTVH